MSASRGLALWRLTRAVPRVASLVKPNCAGATLRAAVTILNTPTQTSAYPGLRLLSRHSSSDTPPGPSGLDSTPHPGQESDTAPPKPEPSAATDTTSDPSSTSDPEMDSDPETTSDSDTTSSESDSELTSDPDEARSAVLEAALLHVAALGWTPSALEEGARAVGMTEAIDQVFPRGGGELIDHFEEQCNSNLVDYLKKRVSQDSVNGSELLGEAVEHRLKMIIPFVNKWPQAMALKAFPANTPTALENLALMVDDVWYYAGDRSTDFNWYTKRALLATIYSSTEVFLVQDTSVDFQETWKFLQRRLEDASYFAKVSREFQGVASGGVEALTAGLNTALSVLGVKR